MGSEMCIRDSPPPVQQQVVMSSGIPPTPQRYTQSKGTPSPKPLTYLQTEGRMPTPDWLRRGKSPPPIAFEEDFPFRGGLADIIRTDAGTIVPSGSGRYKGRGKAKSKAILKPIKEGDEIVELIKPAKNHLSYIDLNNDPYLINKIR